MKRYETSELYILYSYMCRGKVVVLHTQETEESIDMKDENLEMPYMLHIPSDRVRVRNVSKKLETSMYRTSFSMIFASCSFR